jgi:rhodanese-related sulfurtransferase
MKKFLLGALALCSALGCRAESRGFISVGEAEFAKAIEAEGVQIVDARTAGEYASGHIVGAINIDVNGEDFDTKTAKLDKERPVAVYCRSGRRSKIAAERIAALGFKRITELDGGILSWSGEVEK